MLTRWGLHELEGSGHRIANDAGSSGIRTMHDMSIKRGKVGNNPGTYIAPAPSTTSDALIVQALQEEFQRLDATAAAGGPTACVNEQEQVIKVDHDAHGVDLPSDIAKVEAVMRAHNLV